MANSEGRAGRQRGSAGSRGADGQAAWTALGEGQHATEQGRMTECGSWSQSRRAGALVQESKGEKAKDQSENPMHLHPQITAQSLQGRQGSRLRTGLAATPLPILAAPFSGSFPSRTQERDPRNSTRGPSFPQTGLWPDPDIPSRAGPPKRYPGVPQDRAATLTRVSVNPRSVSARPQAAPTPAGRSRSLSTTTPA